MEQGKASQALAYLDKALEIDPDHGQALLNSAILLQEFGRPELRKIARERLLKLLVMDGKHKHCFFHFFFNLKFCSYSMSLKCGNKNTNIHQISSHFFLFVHPFHLRRIMIMK